MQILNPLTNQLFMSIVITFSSMLGVGLIGVLAAVAAIKDTVMKRQLLLRWLSWALIVPITMLAILSGTFPFAMLCAVVSAVCTWEYCTLSQRSGPDRIILIITSFALPLLAAIASLQSVLGLALLASFFLLMLAMQRSAKVEDTAITLIAVAYVPLLASHAVLLSKLNASGPAFLISIITASALANIVAFVFGKIFAGPKLAPAVSPNKTWSGVAGSVVGSFIGFTMLSAVTGLQLPLWESIVIPLVIAAAGVVGDLFESLIKRSFQAKDAGTWLPGFGGALDRVDGLLFVVPCVYYLVSPAL